jgi:hypothetical protein
MISLNRHKCRRGTLMVLAFVAALTAASGCAKPKGGPPTAAEAAAFRGGPPAPGEGKEIADATAKAAEYRRTHPDEFPRESAALSAK